MLTELAATEETAEAEPYRTVETDCAIYVYETDHGRCVAFARRRVVDRRWEAKLTGADQPVYVAPHRGKARGKLRQLVAGIGVPS